MKYEKKAAKLISRQWCLIQEIVAVGDWGESGLLRWVEGDFFSAFLAEELDGAGKKNIPVLGNESFGEVTDTVVCLLLVIRVE